MHMWHHVTNHLIISNDKDSNSENRIKLHVRDRCECRGHGDRSPVSVVVAVVIVAIVRGRCHRYVVTPAVIVWCASSPMLQPS
jgi:hypothetical protein